MPCATQNELNGDDARQLIENKVMCVGEISNMGCTPEALSTCSSDMNVDVCSG
ncbi:MAG: hypothetical protein ACLUE2_15820 [Bacteroides cellulosilyticus]